MERYRLGGIGVDCLTFAQALDGIEALVGRGGVVFTPNVDHVVRASGDDRFRAAYATADLSLADGMPLVWASRLRGPRLPAKVSGSDVTMPLLERAAQRGWSVFFVGGAPGVSCQVTEKLRRDLPGLRIAGWDDSRIDADHPDEPLLAAIAGADLVLVALGSPKQELFIHAVAERLRPAVLVGVGASLDFIAGVVPRAPRWMSQVGLEWLYRLAREPRRLWRRYLVRDPKFLWLLVDSLV